ASDCWAVGALEAPPPVGGAATETLIEHWDGNAWAVVTTPPIAGGNLSAVTCVAASDCWAVGSQLGGAQTLTEHWDGSLWTPVTSPNAGDGVLSVLVSATCMSATDCWAVGYDDASTTSYLNLVERWDGSAWTVVPSAHPSQ